MITKSEFIYFKMNMDLDVVYTNPNFLKLVDKTDKEVVGQYFNNVWAPDVPKSFEQFEREKFQKLNFRHSYMPYTVAGGQTQWIFFNFCPRFDAEENRIGFEYVGYKSAGVAIDYFDPIYKKMQQIEDEVPGEAGMQNAREHLNNTIQALDVDYEKLLCLLQNAR